MRAKCASFRHAKLQVSRKIGRLACACGNKIHQLGGNRVAAACKESNEFDTRDDAH